MAIGRRLILSAQMCRRTARHQSTGLSSAGSPSFDAVRELSETTNHAVSNLPFRSRPVYETTRSPVGDLPTDEKAMQFP